MCVILWVNKDRPTPEMVERAYEHNDDGGGVAWRTTNDRGEAVVEWKKGLGVEEMKGFAETLPIPFIMHFRIASIGGIRSSLTHPFPIGRNASLALQGQTKGHVLFHNGTWKEWNEKCLKATEQKWEDGPVQIPIGRWSDTRALAWLCAIHGIGYMEFYPEQKGIIFGPNDMHIFDGNGWSKINEVWCSNDFFLKKAQYQQQHGHGFIAPGRGVGGNSRFCKFGSGTSSCINQTLDTDGYCYMHPKGVSRMGPDKTVVMGPTNATGGSRVPPSPFVKQERLPLELPPGEVVSVELAEYLHKEKQISHNLLKKIRKHWEVATSPGTKAAKRAELALRQISIKIMSSDLRT